MFPVAGAPFGPRRRSPPSPARMGLQPLANKKTTPVLGEPQLIFIFASPFEIRTSGSLSKAKG